MRRSMVSFTVLLLLVTFMATGCATTTNSDQPDEESVPTIASTTTTSAATQTTSTSDQGTEARTIELDVSDPPVYDNGAGVTLRINDVRVGDLTSVPDDIAEELSFGLDDLNSRAFLIMTITVRNDSTAPVGFFPDQGTALVGSRQVEANFWFSESFTGGSGTILDGASITEDVYFEVPDLADDVAALGQARFTVDGPFDPDSFESLGENVDLSVSWSQ